MHAGGTSAVATSLAQAGASLGVAATPTVDEDAGATACARLTALSDEAMRRMGIAWDSPVALPDRWERSDALKALTPLAIAAVAQEYPAGKAAVVAEPRMCRLLPFWREAFESNGFAVSAALALRRPYEVANELAKRAGLTRRQLHRLFRHHTHMSPREYYRDLRLRHARLMLMNSLTPILEIAVATGFTTHSHFTKCYRQRFGVSPRDDRLNT